MIQFIPLAVCLLIFLTSCSLRSDDAERGVLKARMPLFEAEVTVISLSLDANEACKEKCPGYEYPLDTGILRIEKILSVQNPDNVGMKGYEEGDEINVGFVYSARPARVEYLPSSPSTATVEDGPPELPVSAIPYFARPIPMKDGYFIYRIETSSVEEASEQLLPGVQEGSRIRAKLSYRTGREGAVAEYEMIE
jgi:hypothetical protein